MCVLKKRKKILDIKNFINNPGSFEFIQNPDFRFTLEYDYSVVDNFENGWEILRNIEFTTSFENGKRRSFDGLWDTPPEECWRELSNNMCKAHTEQTYNRNIKILSYIALYGWEKYIRNHFIITNL